MPSLHLRAVSLIAVVALLAAISGWHPHSAVALGEGDDAPAFGQLATVPLALPDAVSGLEAGESGDLGLVWAAGTRPSLPDDADPVPFGPGFLYAPDAMLLVYRDDVERFSRVRAGDALGTDGTARLTPISFDGEETAFVALELLAADRATDEADSFPLPAGDYELTLWQAELPADSDEPVTLDAADDDGPTLVFVVSGSVDLDGDDPAAITSGDDGRTVDGPVTVSMSGESDATVLAVTIGPADADRSAPPSNQAGRRAPATTGNGGPVVREPESSGSMESPSPSDDQSPSPSSSPSPQNTTDTDRDGLTDDEEALLGTDPSNPDTDSDALADGDEVRRGTDPNNQYSDDDSLSDGDEVLEYDTDPLMDDTDGDGYDDGYEIFRMASDPLVFDTDADGDGLLSTAEFRFGTDPNNPDTDGDCLSDITETGTGVLDPTLRDTDGDGVDDYAVYTGGQTCAPPA